MSAASKKRSKSLAVRSGQRLRGPGAPNFNGGSPAPRWVKGESGNPSGRPSKKPITEAYHRILGMSVTELATFKPTTGVDKVAWAMIQRAWSLKDKLMVAAARELTDRMEGTPSPAKDAPKPPGTRVSVHFSPNGVQVSTGGGNGNGNGHGRPALPPAQEEE